MKRGVNGEEGTARGYGEEDTARRIQRGGYGEGVKRG